MRQRIEIDKNYPLKPGDRVELEFVMVGPISWEYFRATQVAMLEWHLEREHPYWRYISMENLPDRVIVRFEIKEYPENVDPEIQTAGGVTAAIICAALLGMTIVFYLSLDKIYLIKQLPDKPSDIAKSTGFSFAGVGLFLLVVWFLLKRLK